MTEEYTIDDLVRGAFIQGIRIKNNKGVGLQWIKLSEIKLIMEYDKDEDQTIVFTYKDCEYFMPVPRLDVIDAINNFIFRKKED